MKTTMFILALLASNSLMAQSWPDMEQMQRQAELQHTYDVQRAEQLQRNRDVEQQVQRSRQEYYDALNRGAGRPF